jgi:hypothetical protein
MSNAEKMRSSSMRSSQVIHNVSMNHADEADPCGDAGSDEQAPDAMNTAVRNAHWQALVEMLWACHAICASPGDPASDPRGQFLHPPV